LNINESPAWGGKKRDTIKDAIVCWGRKGEEGVSAGSKGKKKRRCVYSIPVKKGRRGKRRRGVDRCGFARGKKKKKGLIAGETVIIPVREGKREGGPTCLRRGRGK